MKGFNENIATVSNEYDSSNVFARIIRGELPCNKVYEDEKILAFEDIYPKAPIHILVIPKGPFFDFASFAKESESVGEFFTKVGEIAAASGLDSYKLVIHNGQASGQEIFHFHVHILGNKE